MEKKNAPREEIERTLASLDNLQRAEMPAFFYTRLQAKLDQATTPGSFWQLVTLSLLLVLNIAAVRSYLKTTTKTGTEETLSGIQGFAQEYELGSSSIYNDKTSR